MSPPDPRLTVVVITRNRRPELLRTLSRLAALPERPPVIVMDNASRDGSADAAARTHPEVTLIRAGENLGAVGRNLAVRQVRTPYVAFCDDDSWWSPGAPGPRLGSILAGASVLRVDAFRQVGGFSERLHLGGEEELLSADLAAHGWWMCYADDVLAHHQPSAARDPHERRRVGLRNTLWFVWLRRPIPSALRRTLTLARTVPRDRVSLAAALAALRGLPWVVRERRVAPPWVERDLRLLEAPQRASTARRYVS